MSVRIERLAARGDGVTADGRHVALAAPGDMLEPDGTILPGPHHALPPCRHFPTCGGCQLQHIDDATYAAFLMQRVTGALAAQGLPAPPLRPPHLSPPRTRRRAALRAERTGRRVLLGFNAGASHKIVDLAECHVLRPELFALLAPLRGLLGPLLPARRQAEVRLTLTDQGVDVALSGVSAEGYAAAQGLTDFAEKHGLARLSLDEGYGAETRWEPAPVTVTLGGVAVALPPAAFLQATVDGEAALLAAVRAAIGAPANRSTTLATDSKVLAVEGARDPALALLAAGRGAGLRLAVDHRDLFRRPLAAAELAPFAAVVLDPPRAGAREQMPALAAAQGPTRIAYVSCNPATFARDAKSLTDGGWRLEWIQPVGQFRWSTHVELVAAFAR